MSAKDCLSSLKGFCSFTVYNIIVTLSEKVKAQLSEKVKAQTNVDSVVFHCNRQNTMMKLTPACLHGIILVNTVNIIPLTRFRDCPEFSI